MVHLYAALLSLTRFSRVVGPLHHVSLSTEVGLGNINSHGCDDYLRIEHARCLDHTETAKQSRITPEGELLIRELFCGRVTESAT